MSIDKQTDEIRSRFKKIIAGIFDVGVNEIMDNASFVSDLGASSIEIIQMITSVDEEFGIKTRDEDIDSLATLEDGIKYIDAMLKTKN